MQLFSKKVLLFNSFLGPEYWYCYSIKSEESIDILLQYFFGPFIGIAIEYFFGLFVKCLIIR